MDGRIDRAEIKKEAKKILDGKTCLLFLCNLFFLLIAFGLATIIFCIPNPLEIILTDFIYTQSWREILLPGTSIALDVKWIYWGLYMFFRSIIFVALVYPFYVCLSCVPMMIVNKEKIKFYKIFKPISKARFFIEQAICGVEIYLLPFLWALFFIIPGFMAHYKFKYAKYVFATEADITAGDAIELSKKYTIGNRGCLFNLDLSFLGWFIIGIVTCGLGLIFVFGYYEIVSCLYFNKITKMQSSEENTEKEEVTNIEINEEEISNNENNEEEIANSTSSIDGE